MERVLRDDEVIQPNDIIYWANGLVLKDRAIIWSLENKTVKEVKRIMKPRNCNFIKATREEPMAKFRRGDRVKLIDDDGYPYPVKNGAMGTIDSDGGVSFLIVIWDTFKRVDCRANRLQLIKGGKPMKSKKEYKKGKTVYLQFNCPTNDDDMTMKGSFNKDDMDPDYPFTQVKLTGDLYEMQTVKKLRKVK